MSTYYSAVDHKSASQKHRSPTEATATTALQKRLYYGVGAKFLGFHCAESELQDDDSWKKLGTDGFRHWTVPIDEVERRRWRPFYEHLKGLHRGLVSLGSSYVPFVGPDFDRHFAYVDPQDHICRVLKAGRLLRKHFSELCWIAEVNPRNGSMKYFGFGDGPILIDRAQKLGAQIHELLLEHGCGAANQHGKQEIEVFPHNCVQVGLPMRTDKVTVISSGILPKCIRRRRYPEGGMEDFETYSALAFLRSIQSRAAFDEATLIRELKKGCDQLPHEPNIEVATSAARVIVQKPDWTVISTDAPLGPICTRIMARPVGKMIGSPRGDYRSESNSYKRQQDALLELCRSLTRVATVEEGLLFIQRNGLFTGDWSQNEARRRHRVLYLLDRASWTFDPTKCSGSLDYSDYKTINVGKFDNWARTHVGRIIGRRKRVDEFGDLIESRSVSVGWQCVSVVLSLIEYCCVARPNPDGSLPQNWAEDIWTALHESGRIALKWDDRKWKVARDWLEKQGVIRIVDRKWRFAHGDGQAMKWAVGDGFERLHVWWKRVKTAAINAAVPLAEFLRNMMHCPSLNSYSHTADSEPSNEPSRSPEMASRGPP